MILNLLLWWYIGNGLLSLLLVWAIDALTPVDMQRLYMARHPYTTTLTLLHVAIFAVIFAVSSLLKAKR